MPVAVVSSHQIPDAIVSAEGVVRSSTLISLAARVPYRVLPLVRAAGALSLAAYAAPPGRVGTGLCCRSREDTATSFPG